MTRSRNTKTRDLLRTLCKILAMDDQVLQVVVSSFQSESTADIYLLKKTLQRPPPPPPPPHHHHLS